MSKADFFLFFVVFSFFMQYVGEVATRRTCQLPASIKKENTFSSTQQRNHVKPMTYKPTKNIKR
jgi:hypothetical protein